MSKALHFLIIVLPLSVWATPASELQSLKKRQAGFRAWIAAEHTRREKVETGTQAIKTQRENLAEKQNRARDEFKRPKTLDTSRLQQALLEEKEQAKVRQLATQEAFAEGQKEVQRYMRDEVIPAKAIEYDLKDSTGNDSQP